MLDSEIPKEPATILPELEISDLDQVFDQRLRRGAP